MEDGGLGEHQEVAELMCIIGVKSGTCQVWFKIPNRAAMPVLRSLFMTRPSVWEQVGWRLSLGGRAEFPLTKLGEDPG
jgi:hypothetical protein